MGKGKKLHTRKRKYKHSRRVRRNRRSRHKRTFRHKRNRKSRKMRGSGGDIFADEKKLRAKHEAAEAVPDAVRLKRHADVNLLGPHLARQHREIEEAEARARAAGADEVFGVKLPVPERRGIQIREAGFFSSPAAQAERGSVIMSRDWWHQRVLNTEKAIKASNAPESKKKEWRLRAQRGVSRMAWGDATMAGVANPLPSWHSGIPGRRGDDHDFNTGVQMWHNLRREIATYGNKSGASYSGRLTAAAENDLPLAKELYKIVKSRGANRWEEKSAPADMGALEIGDHVKTEGRDGRFLGNIGEDGNVEVHLLGEIEGEEPIVWVPPTDLMTVYYEGPGESTRKDKPEGYDAKEALKGLLDKHGNDLKVSILEPSSPGTALQLGEMRGEGEEGRWAQGELFDHVEHDGEDAYGRGLGSQRLLDEFGPEFGPKAVRGKFSQPQEVRFAKAAAGLEALGLDPDSDPNISRRATLEATREYFQRKKEKEEREDNP